MCRVVLSFFVACLKAEFSSSTVVLGVAVVFVAAKLAETAIIGHFALRDVGHS